MLCLTPLLTRHCSPEEVVRRWHGRQKTFRFTWRSGLWSENQGHAMHGKLDGFVQRPTNPNPSAADWGNYRDGSGLGLLGLFAFGGSPLRPRHPHLQIENVSRRQGHSSTAWLLRGVGDVNNDPHKQKLTVSLHPCSLASSPRRSPANKGKALLPASVQPRLPLLLGRLPSGGLL